MAKKPHNTLPPESPPEIGLPTTAPEVPTLETPPEVSAPDPPPIRLITIEFPLLEQIADGRIPRFIDAHHKRLSRAEGYALRALFDALVVRGEKLDSRPVKTYYDAVRWLLKKASAALDAADEGTPPDLR